MKALVRPMQLDQLLKSMQKVDLSPTLEVGMPIWPTHAPVVIQPVATHERDNYYNQFISFGEHTGAHVDAPAHMVASMMEHTIDTYPPDMIFCPAVRYDVISLGVKFGERVTKAQILALEEAMGDRAGEGEMPVFYTGQQRYWTKDKDWKTYSINEPGLDEDTVKMFLDRRVRAVGFDNAGGDQPLNDGVEGVTYGHRKYWLPNEIFIVENLQNLEKTAQRFYFMAIPLKIKRGSGSPIRPIALF